MYGPNGANVPLTVTVKIHKRDLGHVQIRSPKKEEKNAKAKKWKDNIAE